MQLPHSNNNIMQLFGIPNCSTVKKARDWLSNNDIYYTFHDLKKEGVNRVQLAEWMRQTSWESLLNKKGMTWRNISEAQKLAVTDAESALHLMIEKSSLIKRPVLIKNGKIISIGFTETAYKELLS